MLSYAMGERKGLKSKRQRKIYPFNGLNKLSLVRAPSLAPPPLFIIFRQYLSHRISGGDVNPQSEVYELSAYLSYFGFTPVAQW